MFATTYSASEMIAIIGAIGALVVTVATAIGNLIIALRTSQKVDANTAITAQTAQTVAVVEGHVNSQTTRLVTEAEALRSENSTLKTTAAVLAANTQSGAVQDQLTSIAADVAETKAAALAAVPAPRPPDARSRATD